MGARAVVAMCIGAKGSGKSFRRGAHWVINEFLPQFTGKLYTTIPVEPEAIYDEVANRTGRDRSEFEGRIEVIPESVIKTWKDMESGPWEYFAGKELDRAHIQLDECHNFCGEGMPKPWVQKYANWLGEIRHQGFTLEYLTQEEMKVALQVRREVDKKILIEELEEERVLGVPLGDVWELKAGLLGSKYVAWIAEDIYTKKKSRWVRRSRSLCYRDPHYFQFYDSFATPVQGGERGEGEKRFHERYSRLGLLAWFLGRNGWALGWRAAIPVLLLWLTLGGGGPLLAEKFLELFQSFNATATAKANKSSGKDQPAPTAAAVASSVPAQSPRHPPMPLSGPVDLTEGDSEVADWLHRIAQLEATIAEQGALIDAYKSEFERNSAVALLTPDAVHFRNGYVFEVGERIDFGPYAGRTLEAIDFTRRKVRLDDGTILRMSTSADDGLQLAPASTGPTAAPGGGVPRASTGAAGRGKTSGR